MASVGESAGDLFSHAGDQMSHNDPDTVDGSALESTVEIERPAGARSVTWGPLELRDSIGRGRSGTVYRAWDGVLEREVALKILHETIGSDDIVREGRLLARVRHPNVVTVYGVNEFDGSVGLWMELVEGLTLARVVATGGVRDARDAGRIVIDLCSAVSAVHDAGLLHRDIKAHNVMREPGGRVVLMDFGAGADRTGSTRLGHAVGTPAYMAPERLTGAEATIATDIYSIGVLLFHLVTLRYPVEGATLDALKVAHAGGHVQALGALRPDLPERFVRAVERALEPDPAARYRSVTAMRQELERVLGVRHRAVGPPAQRPSTTRHTQSVRAYERYLKGRFYWTRRYRGGLTAAVEQFQLAIAEDAGYALAYAGLADAFAFIGIYAVEQPRAAFARAASASARALSLDPDLPEAHTARAMIALANDWDLPAAARAFTRALELDPCQAVTRIYYSWLLVLQGDVAAAMAQVQTARELEPLSPLVNAGAGHTLYLVRRYADAIAACEIAAEVDPGFTLAAHVTGMCRALQGELDVAIEIGERVATTSGRAPFYLGVLGHYYARRGGLAAASAVLDELADIAQVRYVPPHCQTFIYAGANDLDRAFEWQAKAHDDGASPFYYVSPLIENLHGDARHADHMRQMGWRSS